MLPQRFFALIPMIASCFLVTNCSMNRLLVKQTAPLFSEAAKQFEEEEDFLVAEGAIYSLSIILEGLLRSDPTNRELSAVAAKARGAAGYLFLEEKYHALKDTQPKVAEEFRTRASQFFLRGKAISLNYLVDENPNFAKSVDGDLEQMAQDLKKFGKDDVPNLFFLAFNWGRFVLLHMDDIKIAGDVNRIKLLIDRLNELDPSYFHYGPKLFSAALFGILPPLLGGKPDECVRITNEIIADTQNENGLGYLFKAQYCAVQKQDPKMFLDTLAQLEKIGTVKDKSLNLINTSAKKIGTRLKSQLTQLFDEDDIKEQLPQLKIK